MKALIDVDSLCYSVGSFTNPHPFLKDLDGKPIQMPCSTEAIKTFFDEMIEKIVEAANCDDYVLYLSSSVSTNFRNELAVTEPYKGHREDLERPYHHKTVVDHIIAEYSDRLVIADNREADDDLADACKADPDNTVLCSIDKDLDGVEGNHYNWKRETTYYVTKAEALYFFFYQLLVGDWSTDNILGCARKVQKVYGPRAQKAGQVYFRREGVGPEEANRILQSVEPDRYYSVVLSQYVKVWGDEAKDKMVEMANLLYMGGSADKLLDHKKLYKMYEDYIEDKKEQY